MPARAVFLGRINEAKGIFDLLAAWPKIVEQVPHATLVVMGCGDRETERRFHRELGALHCYQTVEYLGFVDPVRKFEELLQARALLFPTYTEQYSLAVAEALACGLRVVGYDIEGFRVNFPGRLDVVPVGDVTGFVRRAVAILQTEFVEQCDPGATVTTSYDVSLAREFAVIRDVIGCGRAR